jgi:uncharacterized membrane protein YccC
MDRLKRYVLEVVLGAILGGAAAAFIVGLMTREGTPPPGPWMVWVLMAAGIAVAVWFGEGLQRRRDS